MTRFSIDCRDIASELECTVAISADDEEELLQAAVHHAVNVHHHPDTPEVRAELKNAFQSA